jgi:GNAT superfamily N-acetyltransferase
LQHFAASYTPDEASFSATFPRLVECKSALFLGADCDGFLSAYLLAHEIPTLYANGGILQISELFVDEPRRGSGLGKALVEAAVTHAWQQGFAETVVPTRRAAPFYEKLGFERTAELLKLRR